LGSEIITIRLLHWHYFKTTYKPSKINADAYYKDTIGVTVLGDKQLQTVLFKVDRFNAPYIVTKPFHSSQKIVEKYSDGSITFSIYVHHNFELERLLLGFGESLQVLSPRSLRRRMRYKFKQGSLLYKEEIR